jgi:outer membrane protein assembly factor BamB
MHRFVPTLITIALLALSVAAAVPQAAQAEDWPQFRGPDGQGHSTATNLPTHWSATENVAWKTELPGNGWSSPVLVDGRLCLTTAVPDATPGGKGFSLGAFCLDAKTGQRVWDTVVFHEGGDSPHIHNKNSHASPTPIVDHGRLYVHFGHMGTACLDLAGKVIWRNDTLHYAPVHGNGGSPALVGNALVFSCDGARDPFVAALNRDTGKELWRTPRGLEPVNKKFSFSTPLAIEVNGQTQVVLPGSDAVMAYDPANGHEIWRVRYKDGYSVIPRPIFAHGLVFICTGFDRPTVMAIRPDGRGDVTDSHVAWQTGRSAPHTPSLLVVGDELYMLADRGVFSCLDAKTGQVHYSERVNGPYSASPLYADGKIYLQSEGGEGVVVQPGKAFNVLARNDLGERMLASYAAGDGALFIRGDKHLYRIQAADSK